jgi:hypothetical protein
VFADRLSGVVGVRLSVTITSSSDMPELSTYGIRTNDIDLGAFRATGPTDTIEVSFTQADRPDEVCVDVTERDGAGIWHGPSETACIDVPKGVGCSATGLAPSTLGLLAGLGALPLVRRRTAQQAD